MILREHSTDMLKKALPISLSLLIAILPACGEISTELEKPLKSQLVKNIPAKFKVSDVEAIILDEPRENVRVVRWEAQLSPFETLYRKTTYDAAFNETLGPFFQDKIAAINSDSRLDKMFRSVHSNEAKNLYYDLRSPYRLTPQNAPTLLLPILRTGETLNVVGKATLALGKEWKVVSFSMQTRLPDINEKDDFGNSVVVVDTPEFKGLGESILNNYNQQFARWNELCDLVSNSYSVGTAHIKRVCSPGSQWLFHLKSSRKFGDDRVVWRFESFEGNKAKAIAFNPSNPKHWAKFEGEIHEPDKAGDRPWLWMKQTIVSPDTEYDIRHRVKRYGGSDWVEWFFSRALRHGKEHVTVTFPGDEVHFRPYEADIHTIKMIPPRS